MYTRLSIALRPCVQMIQNEHSYVNMNSVYCFAQVRCKKKNKKSNILKEARDLKNILKINHKISQIVIAVASQP